MKKRPALLIIRMSALGDVAMTIPVIYSLAQQYPDWDIKVLTQPFFSKLFVNAPANVSFILVHHKGKHQGVMGLLRLTGELRKESVDMVADFHNVLRSRVIGLYFKLARMPVAIVDKDRSRRRLLTRIKNKVRGAQRNYILRYCDVLAQLQLPVKLTFTSLFGDGKGDITLLPAALHAVGDAPAIGVAPFARYKTKAYPLHLMERVVRMLCNMGYRLFLFGSVGEEKEVLDGWARQNAPCTSLPGLLDIRQELVLMSHLDLMLTMDSANMHLASLVNTTVVSLWGSTTPQCGFLGWEQHEENALYKELPCQPCSISGLAECPLRHFSCMKSVSPEEVCRRIEEVINPTNS